jgi:two-component system, sensor histidine kinase
MYGSSKSTPNRVAVLMPTAEDSERTISMLADADILATACVDLGELCRDVRRGADAVVITDDSIYGDSAGQLAETLRHQPAWSAIPIIVLAREGASRHLQQTASDALGNVIIVERPVRAHTLLSVTSSALRTRRHQYQIRDAMLDRERQAEALRISEVELANQAEALREADRRKDEFLATLAHELRNPLAPIRAGVDLLASSPGIEITGRTLGVMQRQISHMVRLIDDLLDISRVTRGKLELKRERVTLHAVLAAAVEASRPLVDRGQHSLDVEIEEESLVLFVDPTRVAQIISNLLNNSSKYTPPGGHIRLTASRTGDSVRIQVHDNGAGIPRGQLARVFDMFSQVNRALERAEGGLGIGLALVKSLVEMHGGSVAAASPGHGFGSTFTVTLPLGAELEAPDSEQARPALEERIRDMRVLVVDDNEDAADLVALLLERAGYSTMIAYDGLSAVRSVENWSPDVVILDIGLPGMSGYDVASELRRIKGGAPPILVALTGLGTFEDKQRAARAGFDLHLTKPVDAKMLQMALDGIDRSRREAACRAAG